MTYTKQASGLPSSLTPNSAYWRALAISAHTVVPAMRGLTSPCPCSSQARLKFVLAHRHSGINAALLPEYVDVYIWSWDKGVIWFPRLPPRTLYNASCVLYKNCSLGEKLWGTFIFACFNLLPLGMAWILRYDHLGVLKSCVCHINIVLVMFRPLRGSRLFYARSPLSRELKIMSTDLLGRGY